MIAERQADKQTGRQVETTGSYIQVAGTGAHDMSSTTGPRLKQNLATDWEKRLI